MGSGRHPTLTAEEGWKAHVERNDGVPTRASRRNGREDNSEGEGYIEETGPGADKPMVSSEESWGLEGYREQGVTEGR